VLRDKFPCGPTQSWEGWVLADGTRITTRAGNLNTAGAGSCGLHTVTSLYIGKCFIFSCENTAPSRYHETSKQLPAADRMVVTFGDGCWRSRFLRNYMCYQYTALSLRYSRITFTKSPSFFMTTFSVSLTNLTALLPQLHDSSCYVSTGILTSPPKWLKKHTDLRTYVFRAFYRLVASARLVDVNCACSWRLCVIISAITMWFSAQSVFKIHNK
jgi:hypothetical protein